MNQDNQNNQNGNLLGGIDFSGMSDAIGMLATTLKSFYDSLTGVGFSRLEAFQLTKEYMLTIVSSKK